MSLFAIGDLHLSLCGEKPMDIFAGWDNFAEKLETNWNYLVGADDTVVVAGDISWAKTLEQTEKDFYFIHRRLSGNKIFLKGNHDYWWNTRSKTEAFLEEKGFGSIRLLYNNAFRVGGIAVCGSRGWINDDNYEPDKKILLREAGRLETSIKAAEQLGGEVVVFLHYPPVFGEEENGYILDVLKKHAVKRCYYGHIHGESQKKAFIGERYGTSYYMISADYTYFTPVPIE